MGSLIGFDLLGDSLYLLLLLYQLPIGAPIATIVIIFELTHSYDLAFVSIICVAGSCLLSSLIFGHSFFDQQLIGRNFKISRGRTEILLSEVQVLEIAKNNKFVSFDINSEKKVILETLKESEFTEGYLINHEGKLIGKVKINNLLSDKYSSSFVDKHPLTISEADSISAAIQKASNFVGESIPVLDKKGCLVGGNRG